MSWSAANLQANINLMDATNAQTSFVELAFGINTFFAQYNYLHISVDGSIEKRVREYEAIIKTIEIPRQDITRLKIAQNAISRYATQHLVIQRVCVTATRLLSSLAAAACVSLLYWDVINDVGHWIGLLLLPYGLYFAVSTINYAAFRVRSAFQLPALGGLHGPTA